MLHQITINTNRGNQGQVRLTGPREIRRRAAARRCTLPPTTDRARIRKRRYLQRRRGTGAMGGGGGEWRGAWLEQREARPSSSRQQRTLAGLGSAVVGAANAGAGQVSRVAELKARVAAGVGARLVLAASAARLDGAVVDRQRRALRRCSGEATRAGRGEDAPGWKPSQKRGAPGRSWRREAAGESGQRL